jgi:hypothetical protein
MGAIIKRLWQRNPLFGRQQSSKNEPFHVHRSGDKQDRVKLLRRKGLFDDIDRNLSQLRNTSERFGNLSALNLVSNALVVGRPGGPDDLCRKRAIFRLGTLEECGVDKNGRRTDLKRAIETIWLFGQTSHFRPGPLLGGLENSPNMA